MRFVAGVERRLAGSVSLLLEDRICYSYDATDIGSLPDVVAWPATTGDVVTMVRVAGSMSLPVVPRGAGTGLTGGSVPLSGGVVISFERMAEIVSVDARRKVAVVEPGIINEALRSEVGALGLTYPPDPASLLVSTIGGNVAEGAGGPRTVLYGTTKDYVVGLEAVLPDGSVVRTGLLADHAESAWDAAGMIIGSEGTLGIVTRIALRLTSKPRVTLTYWAEFPTLVDAARAVSEITALGLPVSVMEIIDAGTLSCSMEYVTGVPPDTAPGGALLLELEGDESQVEGGGERLRSVAATHGSSVFREATDDDEREEIWKIRRAISPSLAKLSSGKINEDIAVPRSAIPRFVDAMNRIGDEAGLRILAFGHAGDGNLHVNVLLDRNDRAELMAARRAVDRLFEAALECGGTLSGEHGIGITKADHLGDELDETALDLTRSVKRAFDPDGLMNPEKILSTRSNPWWDTLDGPAPAR